MSTARRPVETRTPLVAAAAIAARLAAARPPLRPERLSGIHNPWGLAAAQAAAWTFLEICESAEVLDAVAARIGPDIILWDSVLHLRGRAYLDFVVAGREGRWWPADPLSGAVALLSLGGAPRLHVAPVPGISAADLADVAPEAPLYAIRYMPATSRFRRDMGFAPNRLGMEEQPLVNFTSRPLWLVRGEDRAGNDFVTGFAPAVPRWAGPARLEK